MNKTHFIVPAIVLSLAATSALAAPPPDVAAIIKASPTLNASPGASAVVNAKAAQDGVTAETTATEKFSGTNANVHSEDQCNLVNLNISRFTPPQGQTTTFLSYDVRNLCNQGLNASGNIELPDPTFSGDPRKSSTVSLKVDLSSSSTQVLGPPLVADITFTKTNASINRSNYRTVNETNSGGVEKIIVLNTVAVNTTANVTGTLALATTPLPLENQSGTIGWDDTTNLTSVQ